MLTRASMSVDHIAYQYDYQGVSIVDGERAQVVPEEDRTQLPSAGAPLAPTTCASRLGCTGSVTLVSDASVESKRDVRIGRTFYDHHSRDCPGAAKPVCKAIPERIRPHKGSSGSCYEVEGDVGARSVTVTRHTEVRVDDRRSQLDFSLGGPDRQRLRLAWSQRCIDD